MDWKIKFDNDYSRVYEANNNDGYEYDLIFDKQKKTCHYWFMKFVLNESMTWTAQQAEKNESVKWSAKYGHWQREFPDITKEIVEFIVEVLSELEDEK